MAAPTLASNEAELDDLFLACNDNYEATAKCPRLTDPVPVDVDCLEKHISHQIQPHAHTSKLNNNFSLWVTGNREYMTLYY